MADPYPPTTEDVRSAYYFWHSVHHPDRSLFDGFDRWLESYRESVIDEVEDHLVRRDQFTERTLDVIDELREKS